MNDNPNAPQYESLVLRVLWMLVFLLVWQIAQLLLGGLVLVQLIYRLVYGAPNGGLMNVGDSLSLYLAQIGRFGSFHTEQKPWPFADCPLPVRQKARPPMSSLRRRPNSHEVMDIASWRSRAACPSRCRS